jgi:hypothetical protein
VTERQRAVLRRLLEAWPAWSRAESNGERVTLASLYRKGWLERRVWREGRSSADNAHEYRPTQVVLEEWKIARATAQLLNDIEKDP